MDIVRFKKYSILMTLVLGLISQSVFAKKMYRWVDDNGNTFYSDQIPPDQVKHRRESLNENARVVDVLEKEKTKSQRELEKRLIILRKQQEQIIKKQKSHDKVLLSTFRNLHDMNVTLKGKILALDGQRKVVQGNVERLVQQLQQQQKKAAQHERDGRKVPKKLLTEISSSKKQIEQAYIDIAHQFEKKKIEVEKFEADIARFSFLTQSTTESKVLSRKTAEKKAENELGLFICESIGQCEKAWEVAQRFVLVYSSTGIDIKTDRLIMSVAPYKDTDLSLSISKMDTDENKQQLFLDIRCRQSSLGDELCRGPKAKKVRQSFNRYIKDALIETEM